MNRHCLAVGLLLAGCGAAPSADGVLDLAHGVLVTPAELAGPERKAVAMLLVTPLSAPAADRALKIEQEWKGNRKDVDNDAYLKDLDGKDEAVITNSKAWTKLWKAWSSDKPVPKVDFENYILLVVAAPAANNVIDITEVVVTEKGDLQYAGGITQAGGSGFVYYICKIKCERIKTFKGKDLPKK
jgi:hypothetical protein